MSIKKAILVSMAAAGFAAGCATPPKLLMGESFIMNKYAKYMVQRGQSVGSGSDTKELYNYYVRICDVDEKTAKAKGCVDTIVVDNVILASMF